MDIKVLGPGCPKCHQTEKIVKEALSEIAFIVVANICSARITPGERKKMWCLGCHR